MLVHKNKDVSLHAIKTALFLLILPIVLCTRQFPTPNKNEDMDYWLKIGKDEIDRALHRYANLRDQSLSESLESTKYPKNVILFIGDGMSLPTVTAARILKGQKKLNVSGEEQYLTWERFPESAFLKTYVTNKQTGDSAATAVAMFTGVKTTYKTLGYDSKVVRGKPSTHKVAEKLSSILSWAQEAGMKTGFVTNSRLTHATPAALYAHSASRDWECDGFVNRKKVHSSEKVPSAQEFADIARQMIESAPGNQTDVILGGGMLSFKNGSNSNPKWVCSRQDGRDLIKDWVNSQTKQGSQHQFVTNRQQLDLAVKKRVDKVLGIFSKSHLSYDYKRPEYQPSLSEMTESAIDLLESSSDGFFLMVEGAKIDHAHHSAYANLALEETLSFEKAVEKALEKLKSKGLFEDTLVIVTADHSHTMTLPGYPTRGADIKGLLGPNEVNKMQEVNKVYGNGPKAITDDNSTCVSGTGNYSQEEVSHIKFVFPSLIPRYEESHASDDVGLWATGPMAFLFHTTHEQSYVGHVLAFSLCVGHYKHTEYCTKRKIQGKMAKMSKSYVTPVVIASSLIVISVAVIYFVCKKKIQRRNFDFV